MWKGKLWIGVHHASLRWILLGFLCTAVLPAGVTPAFAGQVAPKSQVQLKGQVVDAKGDAVSMAVVTLLGPETQERNAASDASGHFSITAPKLGTYQLQAVKAGARSACATLTVAGPVRRKLLLVLLKEGKEPAVPTAMGPEQPLKFSDEPDFTIAGVTDWTAAGGHGSDATLRASEDLTRSSLAVAPLPAADRIPAAARKVHNPAPLSGSQREQEAVLHAALASNPASYAANQQLGLFYLRSLRFSEAAPPLKRAAELHGATPQDAYDVALACQGVGDLAQARQHVTQALEGEDRADFHHLAAEIDEAAGEPVAAVQHLERAARLDPSEANFFAWGSELLSHRAIQQAAEVFSSAAKAHPRSVRIRTALGAALFAGARYNDAAEQLCAASDLEPANVEPYLLIGKVMLAAPEPLTCAGTRLERFLMVLPRSADAHYFLAMQMLNQNQPASAVRVSAMLREAVELDPGYSAAYLQLGTLAFKRHEYDQALELYQRSIAAEPDSAEAHYRLGVVYDRTGKTMQARMEFQRHDALIKAQAETVEQQRRQVKQFVVSLEGKPDSHKSP